MIVLRDGYWDGTYARRGDTITVEESWAATLEVAGFAAPADRAAVPEPPRAGKPRAKPLHERT